MQVEAGAAYISTSAIFCGHASHHALHYTGLGLQAALFRSKPRLSPTRIPTPGLLVVGVENPTSAVVCGNNATHENPDVGVGNPMSAIFLWSTAARGWLV